MCVLFMKIIYLAATETANVCLVHTTMLYSWGWAPDKQIDVARHLSLLGHGKSGRRHLTSAVSVPLMSYVTGLHNWITSLGPVVS